LSNDEPESNKAYVAAAMTDVKLLDDDNDVDKNMDSSTAIAKNVTTQHRVIPLSPLLELPP
jgi:hypothetical protein